MAFSYPPLDLYYAITLSIKNDELKEQKDKGMDDFTIVKNQLVSMICHLNNKIRYSWYGINGFYFGFNDNSWYIFKYKETDDKTYYYIFGLQLKIVCSFDNQIKFIKKSDEIYNFIKEYYIGDLNKDSIKIKAKENTQVAIYKNKAVFDIFEKYLSKSNQIREEMEHDKNTKIKRQRYFTFEDIDKYKELLDSDNNEDKRYFDYIDMKFY